MANKRAAKVEASEDVEVVSFKGFDKELCCRGFQFEIGKSYEHDGDVEACSSGFHACEYPLNVFDYYAPGESRYCVVKQGGKLSRHDGDTKIASARISIDAEIKIPNFIAAAVKWITDRVDWKDAVRVDGEREGAVSKGYQSAASSTGDQSAASSTGDQSAASSTGDRSAASSTGDRSAASSTGDQSAASSTGYQSAASSTGYQSAAMSSGLQGRVMGKEGNALFLVYRDPRTWDIKHAWAGIAGRDGIKENTWYTLDANGKPVEVQP